MTAFNISKPSVHKDLMTLMHTIHYWPHRDMMDLLPNGSTLTWSALAYGCNKGPPFQNSGAKLKDDLAGPFISAV